MSSAEYQTFELDLSTAGSLKFSTFAGRIVMADAELASGDPALNVKMQVRLGTVDNDQIPLRYNGAIDAANPMDVVFTWEAQTGVTATIFASYSKVVDITPRPFKQIVTSSVGADLSTATVTVGTTAVVVSAADAARQSVLIQADSSNSGLIFIGASGVTAANGIELSAGQSIEIDETTAAVYGISDTAGQKVRVLGAL